MNAEERYKWSMRLKNLKFECFGTPSIARTALPKKSLPTLLTHLATLSNSKFKGNQTIIVPQSPAKSLLIAASPKPEATLPLIVVNSPEGIEKLRESYVEEPFRTTTFITSTGNPQEMSIEISL